MAVVTAPCPHGDATCPCVDGDPCHCEERSFDTGDPLGDAVGVGSGQFDSDELMSYLDHIRWGTVLGAQGDDGIWREFDPDDKLTEAERFFMVIEGRTPDGERLRWVLPWGLVPPLISGMGDVVKRAMSNLANPDSPAL